MKSGKTCIYIYKIKICFTEGLKVDISVYIDETVQILQRVTAQLEM